MCHWVALNRVSLLPRRVAGGGRRVEHSPIERARIEVEDEDGDRRTGTGAMAREPPPERNDAVLLSKIASWQKLAVRSLALRIDIETLVLCQSALHGG